MYTETKNWLNLVSTCVNKAASSQSIPAVEPWERVACDIVGPFPSTPLGNKYIVVFQDKLTWPDAYSTSTTDAIVIANLLLDNIFSVMGGGGARILLTD